ELDGGSAPPALVVEVERPREGRVDAAHAALAELVEVPRPDLVRDREAARRGHWRCHGPHGTGRRPHEHGGQKQKGSLDAMSTHRTNERPGGASSLSRTTLRCCRSE